MTEMTIDLTKYSKQEPVMKDGKYWYPKTENGYSASMEAHIRKNTTRMFVNGKYIPKSHPLHKPGRYKSLDDAWSHEKIESTVEGDVYVIVNSAWPEWVKVGKASIAEDRLNGYQTSSPFRDYSIIATVATDNRHIEEREMHKIFEHFADERRGEWFKMSRVTAIKIFNMKAKENFDAA